MVDVIYKYFPDLSDTQRAQFAALGPLYQDWNQKINVISRKDIDNFYEHHVLHSLAIAEAIQFAPNSQILDLGTGGGFPGIPLAIMFPRASFLLVDSIGKKLGVVESVAHQLGLTNVITQHSRVEDLSGRYDFVVSRAVTRLDEAWGWTRHLISTNAQNQLPSGLLYLKGGDVTGELPHGVQMRRWELSSWYDTPYFAEKSLILLYEKD